MIGVLGVVIIAVAVGLSIILGDVDTPPPPPAQTTEQDRATKTQAETVVPPSFDVVRVNPEGNAVMAGRAHPGSRVEILDGDNVFGSVAADAHGEWVYVPESLLEPGERRLGLRMHVDGHDPVLSDHVVILVVPERGANTDGALALKVRRDGTGPSEVLQKPGPQDVFGVDSVDYGGGNLTISGHASPGHAVQLYIDNHFIGRTITDAAGRWHVTPQTDIAPGTYTLRADMIDDRAQVLARRELPFQRAEPADTKDLAPGSFVVVQPGNSLWRLAQRTYGEGLRFHMIYEANQKLIRDPNLIYPGQVFRLPGQ
ncbi:LysM peptidoglycan-binding domain-containing protein [Magnetovibrio sp.]|uniref:LysM peptidoglycan-binding domain-containing protein n=1 Tax=Magnetovibrio sp. TaxID=2024836 RepID=UPI002F92D288